MTRDMRSVSNTQLMCRSASARPAVRRHNQVTSVGAGALDALVLMRTLDLSFNHITELPSRLFDNTTSLAKLDLSHNGWEKQLSSFLFWGEWGKGCADVCLAAPADGPRGAGERGRGRGRTCMWLNAHS